MGLMEYHSLPARTDSLISDATTANFRESYFFRYIAYAKTLLMDTTTTTANTFDAQAPAVQKMLSRFRNPWLMRLFFFQRLPTLTLWGARIEEIAPERAVVSLPYGWRTQNPFKSIYFAAQLGAAELSTGVLAMLTLAGRGRISMLVTNIESSFTKKADARTYFECTDGPAIQEAVQRAIDTGEGQTITVTSVGRLASGEEVSRARITWSFKSKA